MKKRVWIGIPAGAGGEKTFGNYFRAVREAGGVPFCPDAPKAVPPGGGAAYPIRPADRGAAYPVRPQDCHALLLPGGGDLDPALYRQPNTASRHLEPDRDALEWDLLEQFLRAGKPVLGICRGMQSINVYLGGTLIQDIPGHGPVSGPDGRRDRLHPVRTAPGPLMDLFRAAAALSDGTNLLTVNSSHHQAADRLGGGLEAAQWAEDGVVEAVRHRTAPVWGVQWHPERLPGGAGAALFRAFMDSLGG